MALRLAGDPADAEPHAAAAAFVRGHGGIEARRVFTRIWLALFGLWPWDDLPVLPPELILLPAWAPLNIYDFGCWARQTVVALTVVWAHRPVRPAAVRRRRAARRGAGGAARGRRPAHRWPARFGVLDRVLHAYERLPRSVPPKRTLRRLALARAERWIVRRQEADGCWGGIQPPWVYSMMALHLQGYPLDHPGAAARTGRARRFTIRDDGAGASRRASRRCGTPPWR